MDKLTQAFIFRHACKIFDKNKKITDNEINYILEAGRMSPSSFGMEPWHFVVISQDELKSKLQPLCYFQEQVTSCSHFVILLYRNASEFTLQSDYLRRSLTRELPDKNDKEMLETTCKDFVDFCENGLASGLTINHWSEMQVYLASANMMTAAAYIGIDSCAIGGFQPNEVMHVLQESNPKLSSDIFNVGLCLSFGYRLNEPSQRIRWPLADTCTFL